MCGDVTEGWNPRTKPIASSNTGYERLTPAIFLVLCRFGAVINERRISAQRAQTIDKSNPIQPTSFKSQKPESIKQQQ